MNKLLKVIFAFAMFFYGLHAAGSTSVSIDVSTIQNLRKSCGAYFGINLSASSTLASITNDQIVAKALNVSDIATINNVLTSALSNVAFSSFSSEISTFQSRIAAAQVAASAMVNLRSAIAAYFGIKTTFTDLRSISKDQISAKISNSDFVSNVTTPLSNALSSQTFYNFISYLNEIGFLLSRITTVQKTNAASSFMVALRSAILTYLGVSNVTTLDKISTDQISAKASAADFALNVSTPISAALTNSVLVGFSAYLNEIAILQSKIISIQGSSVALSASQGSTSTTTTTTTAATTATTIASVTTTATPVTASTISTIRTQCVNYFISSGATLASTGTLADITDSQIVAKLADSAGLATINNALTSALTNADLASYASEISAFQNRIVSAYTTVSSPTAALITTFTTNFIQNSAFNSASFGIIFQAIYQFCVQALLSDLVVLATQSQVNLSSLTITKNTSLLQAITDMLSKARGKNFLQFSTTMTINVGSQSPQFTSGAETNSQSAANAIVNLLVCSNILSALAQTGYTAEFSALSNLASTLTTSSGSNISSNAISATTQIVFAAALIAVAKNITWTTSNYTSTFTATLNSAKNNNLLTAAQVTSALSAVTTPSTSSTSAKSSSKSSSKKK